MHLSCPILITEYLQNSENYRMAENFNQRVEILTKSRMDLCLSVSHIISGMLPLFLATAEKTCLAGIL